ncbi:NUDIX domain-containing protein [Maricaulis sp.]|uniref:NUDIX domain-containing protein n=1 Tax=Maricaulis sp. TaxID=1486257 RepID=UPI003A8D56E5
MTKTRGPWTVHDERTVFESPWMQVREFEVTQPDGKPGVYGVMSPRNLALAILPVHADGTITLVGQHRFPLDRYSWEIPEGGGPLGEDALDGARRELKEETGLTADHWHEILQLDLSNSITDERAIGYLATGLHPGEPEPEGTEVLLTRSPHFLDALDEAMSGQITDALTVAMLLRAYYMAGQGLLAAGLADVMLRR